MSDNDQAASKSTVENVVVQSRIIELETRLAEATKLLETGRVGFMNRLDEATWLASVSAWLHKALYQAPEAGCSAFSPDFAWYCQTCKRAVQNEHVTFQEMHDPRCGGCGNSVEPIEPNAALTSADEGGVS